MPNYVTQMSKDSGMAYLVKDTTARQQISEEITAREAAIAAEALSRNQGMTDVKNALKAHYTLSPAKWAQGGLSATTGTDVTASNRIKAYIDSSKTSNIAASTGYSYSLYAYDKNDGSFIGVWNGTTYVKRSSDDNWKKGVTFLSAIDPNNSYYFRVAGRKETNEDIVPTEGTHIQVYLTADPEESDTRLRGLDSVIFGGADSGIILSGIDNLIPGAIDGNGENVENTAHFSYRTDFINCAGIKNLTAEQTVVTLDSGSYMYVSFYDAQKTFISRTGGKKLTSVTAAVPENAEYARVSLTFIGEGNVTDFLISATAWLKKSSPSNKWYVLGDSISAGYYSMTESMAQEAGVTLDYNSPMVTESGEATGSVWDSTLSHNYWGYANKWALGRDLVPNAYPGQGYIRTASNDQNGVAVVKDIDVSDAGLITVAWGFNDWHYNQQRGNHDLIDAFVPYPGADFDTTQITTINQAIWYCLGTLIRKAPNAKIVVQTPMNGWAYGGNWESNWGIGTSKSQSGTLADIHDDIVYWANYYGLQILEMTYNNSIVNRRNIKDTLIDGSHPSDQAHQQLGRHVAVALKYC